MNGAIERANVQSSADLNINCSSLLNSMIESTGLIEK